MILRFYHSKENDMFFSLLFHCIIGPSKLLITTCHFNRMEKVVSHAIEDGDRHSDSLNVFSSFMEDIIM